MPSVEQVDNRRRGRGEDRIPQSEGHASSEYARRLEEPTYGVLPSQDRRPRCYRENEVSVAGRRPMAHRGKPHGCPVRVVLLEVYWHGLTPRLGSVDG